MSVGTGARTTMKLAGVFFLFFVAAIYADDEGKWTTLRVTFGKFDWLPRTMDGAKDMNFTQLDNQCQAPNQLFRGIRMWHDKEHIKEKDPAVILIYDGKGFIAGLQTAVPVGKWDHLSPEMLNTYVLNDTTNGLLTLTVYFIDPSTVCTGRDAKTVEEQGIGTDLYIQVGSDWTKKPYKIVPKKMDDAKDTLWGHGKCYFQMGQHFWYNVTKDMPCDYFVPYCTLYNRGMLNAFCFAINSVLTSPRYEHAPFDVAQEFMEPEPSCFKTYGGYDNPSTMHVYFTPDIALDKC